MVVEIIRKLFCRHKWKLKHKLAIYEDEDKLPIGYKDVYVCEKCLRKHFIKY